MTGVPRLASLAAAASLAALLSAAALAGTVEVYGRPLRGLAAVPVAEVVADPARFADRPVRVAGTGRKSGAELRIVEKDAALSIVPQGFMLPDTASGARWTAEGRIEAGAKGAPPRLLAVGVEVER